MNRSPLAAMVFLAGCVAAAPVTAQPFLPADRAAVDLVKFHNTEGYVSVAATIAYAVRATRGAFGFAGYRVDDRPGEPFKRVRICYQLGIDPPACGIEYLVAMNPPQVTPSDRFDGIGRDFEHGPRAFLRALAREAALQRQPVMLRRIQAALDPYDPYDWR